MRGTTEKDWERFEHEVRHLVEVFGYTAETTHPSHDYGVDVVANSERRRVVIQCKLYGRGRIGGDKISQLAGSRQLFGASDAICITTSYFTKQAKEIAEKLCIHLIDREMLLQICRQRRLTIPSLTVLQVGSRMIVPGVQDQVTIGRTAENRLRVDEPAVSRRHALLARVGLVLTLADCGSTNGTHLNGERLVSPTPVTYGDEFQIGPRFFSVLLMTPSETGGKAIEL